MSNPSAKSCRYNISGFVEELPKLPENRFQHACAALPATGVRPSRPITRVSVYCNVPTHIFQAFVVAGGRKDISNILSSVLTLLPGAEAWTSLASLPRPLTAARASVVGGKIRLVGGYDGESTRSEVMVKCAYDLENDTTSNIR